MAKVKKVRKSTAPYYGAACVWAACAVLRGMYKLSHVIFAAALSVGAFFVLRIVCRDEEIEIDVPDPAPEPTGNSELDKMISDGQKAIAELKRLDDAIADEKISAAIRRLEAVCQQIFDQVRADPSKLSQTHRFMDYYLPTTLKLLNAYDRMDSTGVNGDNIDSTKRRVEDIMDTIVTAFERQLDSLFGSDAMDISTDIAVLENMLEREGLAAGRTENAQNAGGSDIELKL